MKTVFSRFMIFSICIVLFSTMILTGVSIYIMNSYVVDSHTDMLINNAERISTLTEFLSNNYNEMSQLFYLENLNTIAESSESYIVLTDIDGTVMHYSSNAIDALKKCDGMLDISEFSEALKGETTVKENTFDGIFGERTLSVATPLHTRNTVYGLVFVNYPVPPFGSNIKSIIGLMLLSLLFTSFICLVFSYFMSRKISTPISNFCDAAQKISRGEFEKRNPPSNIKEINELSEALNTMAEQLGKNDRARSDFISNVSHDLRTPMTSISGFVDGILDGTIPKESEEKYLAIVSAEVKRLSNLVNVFLDTSRYEMSEIHLNIMPFNICEMIRTIIASQESAITEKNINLNLIFSSENIFVNGDEAAIHRVIANLVDNAAKFCNQDGEINISVTSSAKKAVFSIENTGAEISEEDQRFIWDRFYKTDKSRAKDKKGAGLGLFIVKNIINQHNEKIILKSGDGKTSFIFSLTIAKNYPVSKN